MELSWNVNIITGLFISLTVMIPDKFRTKTQPVVCHFHKIGVYAPENKFFKGSYGEFFKVCTESGFIKVAFEELRQARELYSLYFPDHGCFKSYGTCYPWLCKQFVYMAGAVVGSEHKHI